MNYHLYVATFVGIAAGASAVHVSTDSFFCFLMGGIFGLAMENLCSTNRSPRITQSNRNW